MNNRALWAIAKKAFRNSGGLKSKMSGISLTMGILFTFAFISAIFSIVMPWRDYFYNGGETSDVVFIHTPDSLRRFIDENAPEVEITESRKYDVSAYDFVQFGKIMHEHDAFLVIYFPEDFDEKVYSEDGDIPQILTYYRTDSVIYTEWKGYVVDEYMEEYKAFICNETGRPASASEEISITKYPVQTGNETNGFYNAVKYAATAVIPLILFIGILYMSMNSGTNVIAGEKEKGTFAAVLLSPVRRRDIIIGNILGVSLAAAIPAVIFYFLSSLVPAYAGIGGFIVGLPLLLSLIIFIASATILISVLNDSVVSAQTAFLPVFFILVTICITCIKNSEQNDMIYEWVPLYGHFYGLGNILFRCGITEIINGTICTVNTLILSGVIIFISIKLLEVEAFTVYTDPDSDRKEKRYLTDPVYKKSLPGFLIDQITYPLVILSIFQLLAIIPTVVKYMGDKGYSDFIEDLQYVKTIPDIVKVSFEVLAIFLSDPLFLCLMALGYFLIMVCYFLKTRRNSVGTKARNVRNCLTAIGLKLHRSAVIKYFGGIALGAGLMSLVYIVLNITGQIRFGGMGLASSAVPILISSIIMWIPQGACEELMFRGYMLPVMDKRIGLKMAFVFSSLLFSVFHSMNVGYTPLASVNLFLIALLFALISYKSGSIWITAGAHTAWNFCQGNLYGLQVSGSDLSASICNTSYTDSARDIITGGAFGPEGGLAVTAIIMPLLIIMLISVIKDRKKKLPLWP